MLKKEDHHFISALDSPAPPPLAGFPPLPVPLLWLILAELGVNTPELENGAPLAIY